MPYDELLAQRVRVTLGQLPNLKEKKMFGGVGFLVDGNMACGVHKNNLIACIGPTNYEKALSRPYARVFDMTDRPMKGWVMIEPQGCATESDLQAWVDLGLGFVHSLPVKAL